MAKDRFIPCVFYLNEGNCCKGRAGTFRTYCQKCRLYEPRTNTIGLERTTRKLKVEKQKTKEFKKDLQD